ncbi:MAG: O-antigen ligase family protein [Verrucomicrobia bacterium]|nr:O-antigen ligase family protein [Verrucomicrobiota bacterium]
MRAQIAAGLLLFWLFTHAILLHFGLITVPRCGYYAALQPKLFLWVSCAALAWAISRICECRKRLRQIAVLTIVAGTCEALFGILGLYSDTGIFNVFVRSMRAAGTFSSGNSFGGFLAISTTLTLGSALLSFSKASKHIKQRGSRLLHLATREDYRILTAAAFAASLLVQVTALLLSGSRGAMISTGLVCLLLLLWFAIHAKQQPETKHALPLILALTLTTIALGTGGAFAVASQRMQQLGSADTSTLSRLAIWKGSCEIVRTYPLGVGFGSLPNIFPAFQPLGFDANRVYHAHNDYLELLVELGIPGMLLLILVMGILLSTTARRICMKSSRSRSLWIRRGAFLACLAALIHASVDFNLSSRPGVMALFAISLGIALSRSAPTPKHNEQKMLPKNAILAIALLLVLTPLWLMQLRHSAATILMRQGFTALGGSPSPYHLLPAPCTPPDNALDKLEHAVALAPNNPKIHELLARCRIRSFERTYEELVEKTLVNTPGVPKRLLRQRVSIAFRPEERQAHQAALRDLQRALLHAPDSLDIYTWLAVIYGKLAYLAEDEAAFTHHAESLITAASKIGEAGPHILKSNRLLFRGLMYATQGSYSRLNSDMQGRLKTLAYSHGLHLMRLSSEPVTEVLIGFGKIGINLTELLNEDLLHLDIIWKLFKHYDATHDSTAALASLDALDAALSNSKRTRRDSLNMESYKKQLKQYRISAIRERCRWQLRNRQFLEYRNAASERNEAFRLTVDQELADTENKKHNSRTHLLTLKTLWETRGLPPERLQEFFSISQQYGKIDSYCAGIIAPSALFYVPSPKHTAFLESIDSPAYAPRLALIQAESDMRDGKLERAHTTLSNLLENHPDPDVAAIMLKHADELGLDRSTRDQIVRLLGSISPDHTINMQILGGRCEFVGFSMSSTNITTYWRFRTPVPSDLQAFVSFRTRENTTTIAHTRGFTKTCGLDFGSGMPKLGMVFRITIPFNLEAINPETRLAIGLRRKSNWTWLPSSEGLPFCEIGNWRECVAYDSDETGEKGP